MVRPSSREKTSRNLRPHVSQRQLTRVVRRKDPLLTPMRRLEEKMIDKYRSVKHEKHFSPLSNQDKQKVKKVLGEIAEEVYQNLMFSSMYR